MLLLVQPDAALGTGWMHPSHLTLIKLKYQAQQSRFRGWSGLHWAGHSSQYYIPMLLLAMAMLLTVMLLMVMLLTATLVVASGFDCPANLDSSHCKAACQDPYPGTAGMCTRQLSCQDTGPAHIVNTPHP
jgi:hypothetical protein